MRFSMFASRFLTVASVAAALSFSLVGSAHAQEPWKYVSTLTDSVNNVTATATLISKPALYGDTLFGKTGDAPDSWEYAGFTLA